MRRSDVDIYGLVDDISRHDVAAPLILAENVGAVPALSSYLDSPPRSVPHARLFAVSMLAAIPGTQATVALRRALQRHDLHTLSPAVEDSEWLVQNAVFAALIQRLGPEIATEIDYGLYKARLPAAADAVGQFALTAHIPALIEALSDDILGEPARAAIAQLGVLVVPLLIEALKRHDTDVSSLKRAIAAADILSQFSTDESVDPLEKLLSGAHPALSGAAALALFEQRANDPPPPLVVALTCGTLLPNAALAERCLDVLDTLPPRALLDAASSALALEYMPNLYDVPCSVTELARARLLASLLRRSDIDATQIIERASDFVLLAALRKLKVPPSEAGIDALNRHPNSRVRKAAARIVSHGK
ncbi:MAG: hypothetical protein ACRETC_00700 [Gammaproteobacteria bacterium]